MVAGINWIFPTVLVGVSCRFRAGVSFSESAVPFSASSGSIAVKRTPARQATLRGRRRRKRRNL
ncbi:hypothetical protein CSC33_2878 [Pseudomonas aeruginosa]|nr:hypothetical protein CSC33_2878 [Pseudomonas aeruginosa]